MKLKDAKGNRDWWNITSLLFYISGIEIIILNVIDGTILGGLLNGGINILAGAAFMKKSLPVFRIVRIVLLGALFFMILDFATVRSMTLESLSPGGVPASVALLSYFNLFLNAGMLAAFGMLWKHLRETKQVKW